MSRPSPRCLNWAARSRTPPGGFWHAATTRPASRTSVRTVHTSRRAVPAAGDGAVRYLRASLTSADVVPDSLTPAAVGAPGRGSGGCSASHGPHSSAVCCSPRSRPFSCCYCYFRFLQRHSTVIVLTLTRITPRVSPLLPPGVTGVPLLCLLPNGAILVGVTCLNLFMWITNLSLLANALLQTCKGRI